MPVRVTHTTSSLLPRRLRIVDSRRQRYAAWSGPSGSLANAGPVTLLSADQNRAQHEFDEPGRFQILGPNSAEVGQTVVFDATPKLVVSFRSRILCPSRSPPRPCPTPAHTDLGIVAQFAGLLAADAAVARLPRRPGVGAECQRASRPPASDVCNVRADQRHCTAPRSLRDDEAQSLTEPIRWRFALGPQGNRGTTRRRNLSISVHMNANHAHQMLATGTSACSRSRLMKRVRLNEDVVKGKWRQLNGEIKQREVAEGEMDRAVRRHRDLIADAVIPPLAVRIGGRAGSLV